MNKESVRKVWRENHKEKFLVQAILCLVVVKATTIRVTAFALARAPAPMAIVLLYFCSSTKQNLYCSNMRVGSKPIGRRIFSSLIFMHRLLPASCVSNTYIHSEIFHQIDKLEAENPSQCIIFARIFF